MGSIRLDGVRFVVYSNDHLPRHVHGFTGEVEVVADLLLSGEVKLAERKDCVRPGNAKRSDVRKVLEVAAKYFEELVALWEEKHGEG
jgi:hypothetical protein